MSKEPTFAERTNDMFEIAHAIANVAQDLLRYSDALSAEGARMKAAQERFAKRDAVKRPAKPRAHKKAS